MTAPFATKLQRLACGSIWWSEAEAPKHCPKCKPLRERDWLGRMTTTYAIARVLEPGDPLPVKR